MRPRSFTAAYIGLFVTTLLLASVSWAQFSANIQGVVQDPSGAGVPRAKVDLTNTATHVTTITQTDSSGNYRFGSVAPGSYRVTAEASGFAKSQADVTLLTEQTLNQPIVLKVGATSEVIDVSAER